MIAAMGPTQTRLMNKNEPEIFNEQATAQRLCVNFQRH